MPRLSIARHIAALLGAAALLATPLAAAAQQPDAGIDVDEIAAKFSREQAEEERAAQAPIIAALLAGDWAGAEAHAETFLRGRSWWKGGVSARQRRNTVDIAIEQALVQRMTAGEFDAALALSAGAQAYFTHREPKGGFDKVPPRKFLLVMTRSAIERIEKAKVPDGAKVAGLEDALVRMLDGAKEPDEPALRDALIGRGAQAFRAGRYREARADFARGLDLQAKLGGESSDETILAMTLLTSALRKLELPVEEEVVLRRQLAAQVARHGEGSGEALATSGNIAAALSRQGRHAEAEALGRRVLEGYAKSGDTTSENVLAVTENLADALAKQGRKGEADALLAKVAALQPATSPGAGDSPLARARALQAAGQYAEAASAAQAALAEAAARDGPDAPTTMDATALLADILSDTGRHAEAVPLLRKLLAHALQAYGADKPAVARIQRKLAVELLFTGAVDEAGEAASEALATARAALGPNPAADDPALAPYYNTLGLLANGKATLASDEETKAFQIRNAADWFGSAVVASEKAGNPDSPELETLRGNLADTLTASGRAAEAAPVMRRIVAAQRARLGPVHHDLAVSQQGLAEALMKLPGLEAEAFAVSAEAMENYRGVIERNVTADGRAAVHDHSSLFENVIASGWALAKADPSREAQAFAAAFGAAQDLTVTASTRAMTQAAARTAAGEGPLAEAVRAEQAAQDAVVEADAKLLAAFATSRGTAPEMLRSELAGKREALAAISRRIDREFPAFRALSSPRALPLAEAQAALAPGQALLIVLPVGSDVFTLVVTHDGFGWHRMEGGAPQVHFKTGILRCNVDPATCQGLSSVFNAMEADTPMAKQGYRGFPLDTANELYESLVRPVEPALAGVSRLYFVTTGTLGNLPLSLLVTRSFPEKTDFADPKVLGQDIWLADRFAITQLPSVSGLRLPAAPAGGGGFVGYGSPELMGSGLFPARGGGALFRAAGTGSGVLADPEVLRTLSPLPGTKVELNAMRAALGADAGSLHLGKAATEPAVKGDPAITRAAVIAFATHGLLPGEATEAGEPGLVMTPPLGDPTPLDDGILTASETAALKLTADWVILSACNTASPEGDKGGDSLSGLARGFLYAGARALLASHWRVSDSATAALTVETLAERKAHPGWSRSQALQAAMRTVRTGRRADGSALADWGDDWSHPANWAPFSVIANRDD